MRVLNCSSAGARLREVQLPAVLQPLQDPAGFMARSMQAAEELPGKLMPVSQCMIRAYAQQTSLMADGICCHAVCAAMRLFCTIISSKPAHQDVCHHAHWCPSMSTFNQAERALCRAVKMRDFSGSVAVSRLCSLGGLEGW